MISIDNNNEWTTLSRPQRTRHPNKNYSSITQQERQTCSKCTKLCIVNKNGSLRSHDPCNKNSYEILSSQDEDNDAEINNTFVRTPQTQIVLTPQQQINQTLQGYKGKKTGPKFRNIQAWAETYKLLLSQLEDAIKENCTEQELNNILCKLLTCTPPGSRIENNTDNTASWNEDEDNSSHGSQDLLPAQVQPRLSKFESHLSLIKNDLKNGNVKKAIRKLTPGGIESLTNVDTQNLIRSKYPIRTPNLSNLFNNRTMDTEETHQTIDFHDENIQAATITHIFQQKRGAANSSLGHNNDHIQDLLYHNPETISGLMTFLQLIADGRVKGEAASLLYRGRGVALGQGKKNNPNAPVKIRPIVIQDPIHNLAAHMMGVSNSTNAIEICGPTQLGNQIKGGVEITIHTIRILTEIHPDWAIISFDGKDAFNSIEQTSIIETVQKYSPNLLPYIKSLFQAHADIVYNDHNAKLTMVLQQTNGVQQGNSLSGQLYNITQAQAAKTVAETHPTIKHIQLYDDQYLIGPVDEVLNAFHTLKQEMAKIGIQESHGKSKIYSTTEIHEEYKNISLNTYHLEVVPPEKGLIVGGCPIGSNEFVEEELNRIVDGIKSQLDRFQTTASIISSKPKQDIHTLYCILKKCIASQFNHLLRTCPPSLTARAAARLDDISIKFLTQVTNTEDIINHLSIEDKYTVLSKVFLPASKTGIGITSSLKVSQAAFIGSISLSAYWINKIINNLNIEGNTDDHSTLLLPTFKEYHNIIIELNEKMPSQVENISIQDIWNTQITKIQQIITTETNNQILKTIEANLPHQSATVPNFRYSQYSIQDKTKIVQHIQNKDKNSSAWLDSNPADHNSHMSNSTFITSFKRRIGLPTIANKKYCKCGDILDLHGTHFSVCTLAEVRNQIRNPAHNLLKKYTKDIFHNIIQDNNNTNIQVLSYEPTIDRYFPRHDNQNNNETNDLVEPNQINYDNNHTTNKRADIVIKNGEETIIIDVTIAEATSKYIKSHDKAEDAANQAADIKMKKYMSTHNMTNKPNIKFVIAAVTTQGALSKGFKKLLKYATSFYPENIRKQKLNQIYQRLSTQIHKITNDSLNYALDKFGTTEYPFYSSQNINADSLLPYSQHQRHIHNSSSSLMQSLPPDDFQENYFHSSSPPFSSQLSLLNSESANGTNN